MKNPLKICILKPTGGSIRKLNHTCHEINENGEVNHDAMRRAYFSKKLATSSKDVIGVN
jgi:hypothetical protein